MSNQYDYLGKILGGAFYTIIGVVLVGGITLGGLVVGIAWAIWG